METGQVGLNMAGRRSCLFLLGALCLCGQLLGGEAAQSRGNRNIRTRLSPHFYNVEHCTDKQHALRIYNVTIVLDKSGDSMWNLDFDLLSAARSLSSFEIIIQNCRGAISPNLCEYHTKWSWSAGVCALLRMPGMIWSPLVRGIRPPLVCPIRKDHYLMRNATIDLSSMDKVGVDLDKYIWLVEVQMTDEARKLFICFKFALEPRRVKVKA